MPIILKVISGPHEGREFSFDDHDHFIVGRSKTAQFRLSKKDQYFSRNHFLVEVNPPLCRLLDLNSLNGTFVNEKKVTATDLCDGDIIKAGDTTIQVSLLESSPTPQIAQPVDVEPSMTKAATPPVIGNATIVPRDWPHQQPVQTGPLIAKKVDATGDPKRRPSQKIAPEEAKQSQDQVDQKQQGRRTRGTESLPQEKSDLPQSFERYELIEELGRGGMGVVYRARDRSDGTMVALKVVLPAVAATPEDLARFVREARIVQKLSHPNIVPYRDLGHASGKLYFAMQLVPGINGQTLIHQQNGPLPIKRAVEIVCQLLEALAAAHAAGYVHRDVKPANLIIDPRPSGDFVCLTDFGLARTYQGSVLSGLTTTGNIGGTLPYMAPEQITDFRNVTPAADQYSAAATLYHMLTGSYTYDFPTDIASKLLMVLQEPPRPIEQRCPKIPARLSAVIHKALARLPVNRFGDVAHFRTALQLALVKTKNTD